MFGLSPNIIGGIGAKGGVAWQEPYGCFETAGTEGKVVASTDGETAPRAMGIRASLSSEIYNGTKLQPSALSALPCIKY